MQTNSTVGPQVFPLVPGALDGPIVDQLLDGLLGFCKAALSTDLDAVLANLRGTSSVAVRTTAVLPWDPTRKPSPIFLRGVQDGASAAQVLPALYAWREGSVRYPLGMLQGARKVDVRIAYIFDELTIPGAWVDRYGIDGAVSGSIERHLDIGWHPAWQGGATLGVALGLAGPYPGIWFERDMPMQLAGGIASPTGQDQTVIRGFPLKMIQLSVVEAFGFPTPSPAEEQPQDITTSVNVFGNDPLNAVRVFERVTDAAPHEEDT